MRKLSHSLFAVSFFLVVGFPQSGGLMSNPWWLSAFSQAGPPNGLVSGITGESVNLRCAACVRHGERQICSRAPGACVDKLLLERGIKHREATSSLGERHSIIPDFFLVYSLLLLIPKKLSFINGTVFVWHDCSCQFSWISCCVHSLKWEVIVCWWIMFTVCAFSCLQLSQDAVQNNDKIQYTAYKGEKLIFTLMLVMPSFLGFN